MQIYFNTFNSWKRYVRKRKESFLNVVLFNVILVKLLILTSKVIYGFVIYFANNLKKIKVSEDYLKLSKVYKTRSLAYYQLHN